MSFSVGTKNVVLSVVTEEKTALSAKSGSLPVFATPFLVALMEQAASELSEKEVEEGFTTVGTEISVSCKKGKALVIGDVEDYEL